MIAGDGLRRPRGMKFSVGLEGSLAILEEYR